MKTILNFFDIWSWPYNVYYDIMEWNIMRKAVKEEEVLKELKENDLRVDNLSRIYTVIVVPKDMAKNANTSWPVIMEKLKPFNTIMAKIGLSDIVFPRIDRLDEYNYLIILAPEFDYLNIKAALLEPVKWIAYYILLGTINNILLSYFGVDYLGFVGDFFASLLEFLPF